MFGIFHLTVLFLKRRHPARGSIFSDPSPRASRVPRAVRFTPTCHVASVSSSTSLSDFLSPFHNIPCITVSARTTSGSTSHPCVSTPNPPCLTVTTHTLSSVRMRLPMPWACGLSSTIRMRLIFSRGFGGLHPVEFFLGWRAWLLFFDSFSAALWVFLRFPGSCWRRCSLRCPSPRGLCPRAGRGSAGSVGFRFPDWPRAVRILIEGIFGSRRNGAVPITDRGEKSPRRRRSTPRKPSGRSGHLRGFPMFFRRRRKCPDGR